jgi:hypothetical protein
MKYQTQANIGCIVIGCIIAVFITLVLVKLYQDINFANNVNEMDSVYEGITK